MKLKTWVLLAAVLGAPACGFAASEGGGGFGGFGGEGGVGGGGEGGFSSPGSGGATGTTTSATGTGGGSTQTCSEMPECGNIGSGCIGCAIQDTCAAAYSTCFDDAECTALTKCLAECSGKGPDCPDTCASQHPNGAPLHDEMRRCVYCDVCAAACATDPAECTM